MCFVSVITDHYTDRWQERQQDLTAPNPATKLTLSNYTQLIPPSPTEIAEFRSLLEKAREYDKKMNQPHCELEEKKKVLRELAKVWGIDLSFIETENKGV